MKLGMIGQGFIGKAYANDFETRGYEVVRYSNEKAFIDNKEAISTCDIVFIAVPTPTTVKGFDYSIVEEVLHLVGKNKIAVIKSTLIPGTTEQLQEKFQSIYLFHSPEFLVAKNAEYDAKYPVRNIVGHTNFSKDKAELVLSVLPSAKFSKIIPSKEAEMVKYMGNIFLTKKVIFANLINDLCKKIDVDYETVKECVGMDNRITLSHLNIDHDKGRGAGGYCFIKDLAAFSQFYEKTLPEDQVGKDIFKSLERKNINLLKLSKKDLELLKGVYGEGIME